MDNCKLIKPDISYEKEIAAFLGEMLSSGSSMDGTGTLRNVGSVKKWLKYNRMGENKETVPENLVTADQYIYVREDDRKIVGMIQFRHYFNGYLEKFGGHIGYSVRPNERRKGYAKAMLHNCLQHCKAYGLDKILITCIEGNEGSRRTIIANGGIYENTVYCERDGVYLERYWIYL